MCMSFTGCAKKTSTDVKDDEIIEQGKLLITVTDKATKKPVTDAKIVIAGLEDNYSTNDKGQSPEISLKVNKDIYKKYGAQLYKKAAAGSATIVVSKEGFKDYIMFNKPVYPGYSANNVNIQMEKSAKTGNENYVADIQYPHELWIQELVEYCKGIKEEKNGSGEYSISVNVKDSSSKPVADAFIAIPELGIKVLSDKDGKAMLKPAAVLEMSDVYPVKRQLNEYTVIVGKDGYITSVIFNVTAKEGKEGKVSAVLKTSKGQQPEEYSVSCQPYDQDWVVKVIGGLKDSNE